MERSFSVSFFKAYLITMEIKKLQKNKMKKQLQNNKTPTWLP
jgi:hypothetical protein